MSERTLRRLARGSFVLIAAMYGSSFALSLALRGSTSLFESAVLFAVAFSFPAVGSLVASRQPRNPIGWIMLGMGLGWAVGAVLDVYASSALTSNLHSIPAAAAAAIASSVWVPGLGPVAFLLLLFPTGTLLSRRWRWVGWVAGIALALVWIGITFSPGKLDDAGYPHLQNPLGIPALKALAPVLFPSIALIPLSIVAAAVSMVIRFRRSRGVERLQMKWFTAASATVGLLYLAAMVFGILGAWNTDNEPILAVVVQDLSLASFVLIPIAIGFAILRYRLYDIDRIISRALGYGLVTAFLAAVYVGVVIGIGSALGTTDNPLLIAAATLVVAALFNPVRRRAQAWIDRRFSRRRYDAQRTLEAFGARLREEVDLTELRARLVAVVGETMQPATVQLWLRPQRELPA